MHLLYKMFIGFGFTGISEVTTCSHLPADLVLFSDERDFMLSLSDKTRLMLLKRSRLLLS